MARSEADVPPSARKPGEESLAPTPGGINEAAMSPSRESGPQGLSGGVSFGCATPTALAVTAVCSSFSASAIDPS